MTQVINMAQKALNNMKADIDAKVSEHVGEIQGLPEDKAAVLREAVIEAVETAMTNAMSALERKLGESDDEQLAVFGIGLTFDHIGKLSNGMTEAAASLLNDPIAMLFAALSASGADIKMVNIDDLLKDDDE